MKYEWEKRINRDAVDEGIELFMETAADALPGTCKVVGFVVFNDATKEGAFIPSTEETFEGILEADMVQDAMGDLDMLRRAALGWPPIDITRLGEDG